MTNLFDRPTTLRNPDHFVGRAEQLGRIFGLIQDRQSVALVGPRRIGKTSLLTYLRSPAIQSTFHFDGEHFCFLYLDLQKRSMKARVDFFTEVCRTLREYSQNCLEYVVAEGLDKDDEFDILLDEFKRRDLYPVLMMDAFDDLTKYPSIDEDVFGFLRAEGSEGRISYITASMKPLGEIFRKILPMNQDTSSPWYNIFAPVRLSSFLTSEAQEFLLTTSDKSGSIFAVDEVEWVVRLAGTHPFLLQQVATLLFEAKLAKSSNRIDHDRIQREVQQNLFSHFEDTWNMLNNEDRLIFLEDIASGKADNLLEDQESRICPEFSHSQLFRNYLRDTGKLVAAPLPHTDFSEITIEVLKGILNLLDDPELLGKSALTGIPFIRARIERQSAKLSTMRGKIVKDSLKEALEGLKGQEPHTDGASDWVHYDILNRRYFMRKHNVNQDIIAYNLGLSERQYYRVLTKSLERLKNALQTLDTEEENDFED